MTTKDEKFASGATIGGVASVIGHGATGLVVKAIGVKAVECGAITAGFTLAISNLFVGAACLVGGLVYIANYCR